MKRVLIESSGSLVASWMIKRIQESGHTCIASDVIEHCASEFLADEYIIMPKSTDDQLWTKIERILVDHDINIVIPSFDDTLLGWSERKSFFKSKYGIDIIVSANETVKICQDKLLTYYHFIENHILTPMTSDRALYSLFKPRKGSGSKGILFQQNGNVDCDMSNYISQVFIEGTEYTVDCLVDYKGEPIYVIPRKRLRVNDGKSVDGIVCLNSNIISKCLEVINVFDFCGPINIQCIENENGIFFIEINPRIAGGMALGMEASENWIPIIVDYISEKRDYLSIKSIRDQIRMFRHYEEIFK